jgi:uncharacterized protein (DUF488 family)
MSFLPEKQIFTVGHSTRALEEFLTLLRQHAIGCLIDVRTAPRSRRMPHFAKASLAAALPERQIEYIHEPRLGGWRRPVPGSPNTGWRNKGFQGYADHMATPEFETALGQVMEIAAGRSSSIMCAEALWWQCHRMLISDALTVRGWRVLHIGAGDGPEVHKVTSFAVVAGVRLSYPAPQGSLLETGLVSRERAE